MKYVKQRLEGKKLDLDSDEFVECELFQCTLRYGGKTVPDLRGNKYGECTFDFHSEAKLTMQFLLFLVGTPEFRPGVLDAFGLNNDFTKH